MQVGAILQPANFGPRPVFNKNLEKMGLLWISLERSFFAVPINRTVRGFPYVVGLVSAVSKLPRIIGGHGSASKLSIV